MCKQFKMHLDVLIGLNFMLSLVSCVLCSGRCDTVLSPSTVCSSTMAAMGSGEVARAGPGGIAVCLSGPEACASTTTCNSNAQSTLVS